MVRRIIYIHERPEWPSFHWDFERISTRLVEVRHRQGRLIGRMEGLGFQLRTEAVLYALTEEDLKSSEIEGEKLDKDQVRSSIARRLGIDIGGLTQADRNVEGVVEMMLDATQHYERPLTTQRLFDWHAALFPTGRSGMSRINVGAWRDDRKGAMQVVFWGRSGSDSAFTIKPPVAVRLRAEMKKFIDWFEKERTTDLVLMAGVAHLWFVTIHPFEDGNGRIARAIADMVLARSERSPQRFYSMSSQIRQERREYYEILQATQRGELDITGWLEWFLACLERAFDRAETILASVLSKARFWDRFTETDFNERERSMINRLLNGFEGKLTSSKWGKLEKCSQDTALRDIEDLINKGVITKDSAGGRSTSYSLAKVPNKS